MSAPELDGLRPPRAPRELRERTLRAVARAASAAGPWESIGNLLDELARSRRFRLAWFVTVLLLLAGHLGLAVEGADSRLNATEARPSGATFVEEIDILALEARFASRWGNSQFTVKETLDAVREEL